MVTTVILDSESKWGLHSLVYTSREQEAKTRPTKNFKTTFRATLMDSRKKNA